MRRHSIALLTMLTLGIASSASAQTVFASVQVAPPAPQATLEHVVARLMSFDRNDDGQLARAELPERMHDLLTRGDGDHNQILDVTEVRRLAASPTTRTVARGLEAGQYGFGDSFGLDTRLHIEGAIDDLRLSATERGKALEIARRFDTARQEKAKSDLLQTMREILASGSFEDFKAALEFRSTARGAFPALSVNAVGTSELTKKIETLQSLTARIRTASNLARAIDKYGLQPDEQKRAHAAVEQYNETTRGRLSDADRQALLAELQPILADEQIDDLRAALERRPIVKQNAGFVVRGESFTFPPDVRIQNLVVKD